MTTGADPRIVAIAVEFVDGVVLEQADRVVPEQVYVGLIDRTAQAMQLAIEQECDAIRQELQS